jgi:Ca2+/H+ antiporter, TMEM165/GDT1 family
MLAAGWVQAGPSVLAAFLASLVECVEALTIVLAVGSVRGWRGALSGSGMALVVLLAVIAAAGQALALVPLDFIQAGVGALLVLFGLRWLRKAILRASGTIPLHEEGAIFAKETAALRRSTHGRGWDGPGFAASFQATMLEGIEVVFIVVAIGAGKSGLLLPASLGAVGALAVVIVLGIAVRRPLAAVPENTLKFLVGCLLSAFGTFWVGEGMGIAWPGGDWAMAGLILGFLAVASAAIRLCRGRAQQPAPSQGGVLP